MKIIEKISSLVAQRFGKPENMAAKSERCAEYITTTAAFSKLKLQDQIVCLGKLIQNFGSDDGYNPSSLERTLLTLNQKLKRQINNQ